MYYHLSRCPAPDGGPCTCRPTGDEPMDLAQAAQYLSRTYITGDELGDDVLRIRRERQAQRAICREAAKISGLTAERLALAVKIVQEDEPEHPMTAAALCRFAGLAKEDGDV